MVERRIERRPLRTTLFLVVSTLVIFTVGCVTFAWQVAQKQSGSADNNNIVGQPSLPAASVNAIFSRAGSPMAGTGAVVEQAARKTNIDDAFALAVWWIETNDGMAGVGLGAHNPGGVKGSASYSVTGGGYTVYPSYAVAVTDWFNIVKARYVNTGLTSIYTICRPYVGTATACSAGGWAGKVSSYMQRYRAMAPPTPTPKPIQKALASKPVHGTLYFNLAATPQPRATTVADKANGPAGRSTTNDVRAMQRTLLPIGEAIGIGVSLLLALAIASWGMFLRYGMPAPDREGLSGTDDAAICPAVFTSQLPSLSDSNPLPAFQPVTEQFAIAATRATVTLSGQQQRSNAAQFQWQPLDGRETQMYPPASNGGMVHTDNLPTQFGGLHLPTRTQAPQGVPSGGGGLLRRYRGEQSPPTAEKST